jgi:hypothetical protein
LPFTFAFLSWLFPLLLNLLHVVPVSTCVKLCAKNALWDHTVLMVRNKYNAHQEAIPIFMSNLPVVDAAVVGTKREQAKQHVGVVIWDISAQILPNQHKLVLQEPTMIFMNK